MRKADVSPTSPYDEPLRICDRNTIENVHHTRPSLIYGNNITYATPSILFSTLILVKVIQLKDHLRRVANAMLNQPKLILLVVNYTS